MDYIQRENAQTCKEIIEKFIQNELNIIGKDLEIKTLYLTPLIGSLGFDGTIYKIMDEVCDDLTNAGWSCFYKHYYTFVSTCYLTIYKNVHPDLEKSKFKFFVPCAEEYKNCNSYYPTHPLVK